MLVNRCRTPLLLLAILVLGSLGAACTATPAASVATAAPTPPATPVPTAAPTAVPPTPVPTAAVSASPQVSPQADGQTDTPWGRIWDSVPPPFPTYPGAQPAPTGAGPASATLQLPAQADVAADWTREALEAAGWTIAAMNGPLEDGSFVIDVTGQGACKVQVSIAPTGGVTIATILYGAACPFA